MRARLTGARLTQATLTQANLTGANLTRANLTGADLLGARLDRATLTNADLRGTRLVRARLRGARLQGARFGRIGSARTGVAAGQLSDRRGSWCRLLALCIGDNRGVDLRGAYLRNAVFLGANMAGANLAGAILKNARIDDTNLSGADFSGASFGDGVRVGNTDLQGANFTGATLKSLVIDATNLTGANLSGLDLRAVTFLDGVVLRGANLTGANLTGVDLSRVTMEPADLRGAIIDGATLPADVVAALPAATVTGSSAFTAVLTDGRTSVRCESATTCTSPRVVAGSTLTLTVTAPSRAFIFCPDGPVRMTDRTDGPGAIGTCAFTLFQKATVRVVPVATITVRHLDLLDAPTALPKAEFQWREPPTYDLVEAAHSCTNASVCTAEYPVGTRVRVVVTGGGTFSTTGANGCTGGTTFGDTVIVTDPPYTLTCLLDDAGNPRPLTGDQTIRLVAS